MTKAPKSNFQLKTKDDVGGSGLGLHRGGMKFMWIWKSKGLTCVHAQSLSRIWFFASLWTRVCQAPLSMGLCRQEYWSGLPFSPPGDLPDPEIEPLFSASPALAGQFFTTEPPGKIKRFDKYLVGHARTVGHRMGCDL